MDGLCPLAEPQCRFPMSVGGRALLTVPRGFWGVGGIEQRLSSSTNSVQQCYSWFLWRTSCKMTTLRSWGAAGHCNWMVWACPTLGCSGSAALQELVSALDLHFWKFLLNLVLFEVISLGGGHVLLWTSRNASSPGTDWGESFPSPACVEGS